MRQKTGPQTSSAEKTIKDIRRATRKHHSSEAGRPALGSVTGVEPYPRRR